MSGVGLIFVETTVVGSASRSLAEVHITKGGQIIALMRARISADGSPEYQISASVSPVTPNLGATITVGSGGVSFDLDGDGAKDTVSLQGAGVSVSRYTGFGFTSEEQLASYVFNVRLGYMAAYYSALAQGSQPRTGSIVPAAQTVSNLRADLPLLRESAATQVDARFNCTNYDILFDRRFVLGQGTDLPSRLDMQAVNQGMIVGWADGEADASTLSKIIDRSAFLIDTKKVSTGPFSSAKIPKDDVAFAKYSEWISDMAEFPLFKATFKDRATGMTLSVSTLSAVDPVASVELGTALAGTGDLTEDFVRKLSDPWPSELAPICKAFSSSALVCNPAIAAGRAVAFLSVLAAVSLPSVGAKLMAAQNPSDVSVKLRREIAAMNQPLEAQVIRGMSKSVTGIAALEFREGFRASTLFLDNALAEQFREAGRREAAQEIVVFLKKKFPTFNPGTINTVEDAKRYIADFIGLLYSTIAQLQGTISKLNPTAQLSRTSLPS